MRVKIDLLKLIFRFHLPETILEGETEILV